MEDNGRTVFGVVTDGFAYSDLVSPLQAVIGAEGDPAGSGSKPDGPGRRFGCTLPPFCARYRRNRSSRFHSVPSGWPPIAMWCLALRMDGYTADERATGIPVGLYAAGGLESPVYLDADFLLGPEAAHLNITGVSGLATKTSAVEFLLGSIFQTFPAHKGTVAALCFNVKGPDLCFLDQPATLSEEDLRQYARLGLTPRALRHRSLLRPA